MYKVLDNTFLSAAMCDITSVDLYDILTKQYPIVLTKDVIEELGNKKDYTIPDKISKQEEIEPDEKTMEFMKNRYGWIGKGENSAIIHSIEMTHADMPNYVVTDDYRARELLEHVHEDVLLHEKLGYVPKKIQYTGTVGLVLHLRSKGLITDEQCHIIANELEKSSFRISKKLLDMLRS